MSKLTKEQKELFEKLTKFQSVFFEFYIGQIEPNQTSAYLAACNATGKKPAKNPRTAASELLTNPNIERLVGLFREKAAESTQINAEYVLKRLKEIDELDIVDIMMPDMESFKPINEWPKSWRTSISGIDMQHIISGGDEPIEKVVKKIKWPDKTKNLELLGKHVDVQAFKDRVELGAAEDLVHLIQQGRARALNNDSDN